ncbi:MAG: hypothetical protein ACOCTI_08580 [Phycisphaeraceae bacterium]
MSQPLRIGEILVAQGVLDEQQVFEILQAQKRLQLPFGVLAERMFDVTLETIENAWVEQYHRFTGTIDLDEEPFDDQALRVINRRQAWQFQVLPIRIEKTGELTMAASACRLPRAVTFAAANIDRVVYFRIAESDQLRRFLQKYYPMPEISQDIIDRAKRMVSKPHACAV